MSAQFGRWHFEGAPSTTLYMEKVRTLLRPYGPDGEGSFSKEGINVLYRAFHTTTEARQETQPCILSDGAVLTWDGRLDNRKELVDEMRPSVSMRDGDVSIAAAAYARWGTDCFPRILGDWAMAIWNPRKRVLVLAKDFLGTRHLYYSIESDHVRWSTLFDPLVLLAEKEPALHEEYFAGWFSGFPAAHLTPYAGIHAVPPGCSVTIAPGKHIVSKYWDFDGSKRILHRGDAEYEEQFRTLFAESVRRRLRSDSPILAELSGGMDSSAIVCMGDHVIAPGISATGRVDTVSYYNDFEPNWNERPYFTEIEKKRGREGLHIDTNTSMLSGHSSDDQPALLPGYLQQGSKGQLNEWMRTHGHRVMLSGTGGDEVMGGVPTPLPELEDLLVGAKFKAFAHQLGVWALYQRRPWFQLFSEVLQGFLPRSPAGLPEHQRPGAWFRPEFVRRNRSAFLNYQERPHLLGPLPSFQQNLHAVDTLRRQLACTCLTAGSPYEKRYPCLDRSLLEFLFAIPREQLVRPGHRRSLMRRALVGIVPDEVLNRRRKAYVSRSPIAMITAQYSQLVARCGDMVTESLGFVDAQEFRKALQEVQQGRKAPNVSLMRTLGIEDWLQRLRVQGILDANATTPCFVLRDSNTPTTAVPRRSAS